MKKATQSFIHARQYKISVTVCDSRGLRNFTAISVGILGQRFSRTEVMAVS